MPKPLIDVESVINSNCKCLTKIDKARANKENISDDFEHVETGVIIESKRAATTVNQVHPLKADVVIVSKSDNEHIALTMGELFPLLKRQHSHHKWDCANASSKSVNDNYGPWISNDNLNIAVEFAVARALDDVSFKQKQQQVRKLMGGFHEQLDSI